MSTYQDSHPWINFQINLQSLDYRLWLLLGRAQSKVEHILNAPVSPEIFAEFRRVYLARGALATTAIEGNTLTEEQVQDHISGKLELPPSKKYLGQEIGNVVAAYNKIGKAVFNRSQKSMHPSLMDEYNALVLKDLALDEDIIPGQLRSHNVTVGRYLGAPAQDLPDLMQKFCTLVNDPWPAPAGYEIAFGILKAIVAHVYLAWIHPYGDGNGRTARLVEFQIMLAAGVPDTAAHLLSNFYNETRTEYYRHLDKTSRDYEKNGLFAFVQYALQGFVDALDEQIRQITYHQLSVQWRNYVYDEFRNTDSVIAHRRRRLVLDMTDTFMETRGKPIALTDLRHISPRIIEAYSRKHIRTISRDLKELIKMNLVVESEKNMFAPNLSIMQGFRPRRVTDTP